MDDPSKALDLYFENNHEKLLRVIETEQIGYLKENGYMDFDGEPLKCWHCESEYVKEIVTDKIDLMVVEKNKVCGNTDECGELLGSWAYGSWQEYD